MKIVKANDGQLTNFEVLDFLRSRGASKEIAISVAPSEYKVFEYLVETAACNQTKEDLTNFVQKAKPYNLAKAELLNIINMRPSSMVGIYAIAEDFENRFEETGNEDMVELVIETLPAPPSVPEDPDADPAENMAADDVPDGGGEAEAEVGGNDAGEDDLIQEGNSMDAS